MTKLRILVVSAAVLDMSAARSNAQADGLTATYGSLGYTEDINPEDASRVDFTARTGTVEASTTTP